MSDLATTALTFVPTPRDIRFHAAGHLAAAVLLVEAGDAAGAKVVLNDVVKYLSDDKVDAPPQLKALADSCAQAPGVMLSGIKKLEQWFCDPFNTAIENSCGGFGAG